MVLSIKKKDILFLILLFGFLFILVLLNTDLLFCAVILVWALLFYYSIRNIKERSVLFAFLTSFFLFLLGRDFLENVFHYRVESFDANVNRHAYTVYLIALITIFVLYPFFSRRRNSQDKEVLYSMLSDKYFEKASLIIYYVSILIAIASKLFVVGYVSDNGYFSLYTTYNSYVSNNLLITIFSYVERIMPLALCGFFSSFPKREDTKLPIAMFVIYLLVSLGTGSRSTFMLGILFLIIYLIYRQSFSDNEKWFSKRIIIVGILLLPVLAILSSVINYLRNGTSLADMNPGTALMDFFYDQGVTSNVIKRAYQYQYRLPSNVKYTFEFLHSGIFARIFGFDVYYGNSEERALYGGSFAHAIAYIVLGDQYLAGQGTGTSYLAEFFHDYSYWGVIFGTGIYTFLISTIATMNSRNTNNYIRTVQFYLIQRIIWAPRGAFADIINSVFSVQVVAFIILSYLLVIFLKDRTKNKRNTVSI